MSPAAVTMRPFPSVEGEVLSPDARIAALAARQHGAFARRQALAVGFTRAAILHRRQSGRWVDLQPGAYAIAGSPATPAQRIIAVVLSYGPQAVVSSVSSAWLLGCIEKPPDLVYVALPPGQRRRPRKGVVLIQAALSKTDVRTVNGMRVTGPERSIVDAAGVLTASALESLLDDAVQVGLTTVPKLRRYIRERNMRHRPGAKVLRELLEDRTSKGVPHKDLEKLFWRKLRATDLPMPTRQQPCGDFFIDVAYPSHKLAVELDGLRDHFSAEAFRRDRRRQNQIVLAGYTVLRFTWEDVEERWPTVEATIRRALPH